LLQGDAPLIASPVASGAIRPGEAGPRPHRHPVQVVDTSGFDRRLTKLVST
jgi:hypothetical protein